MERRNAATSASPMYLLPEDTAVLGRSAALVPNASTGTADSRDILSSTVALERSILRRRRNQERDPGNFRIKSSEKPSHTCEYRLTRRNSVLDPKTHAVAVAGVVLQFGDLCDAKACLQRIGLWYLKA